MTLTGCARVWTYSAMAATARPPWRPPGRPPPLLEQSLQILSTSSMERRAHPRLSMMNIALPSRSAALSSAPAHRSTSPVVPRPSVFRRDELLGARWVRYIGGIKVIDGLDASRVRALIDEGFLSATSCANPNAPSAETMARFLARWAPAAKAGGYARSHRTSDGAVVLDCFSLALPLVPAAARDRAWWEFFEIAVDADGHDDRGEVLRAWWE